jgi:hypothetical protein
LAKKLLTLRVLISNKKGDVGRKREMKEKEEKHLE